MSADLTPLAKGGMRETLTRRIEHAIDRWNMLPREQRHDLSDRVVAASLGLNELGRLHRTLTDNVDELEGRLDRAETVARDEGDGEARLD